MSRKNRTPLASRVVKAAEAALAAKSYVSSIDVLVGIGWLDAGTVERWRRGQIDCLERVVQVNLPLLSEAMKLFRSWAIARGLSASPTQYVARTPQRQMLRFSRSGGPALEELYRTHWLAGELSGSKRERLAERASRAPELVVVQPLNREWICHRCGGTGDLLLMEDPGPACLRCVGLDDLEYLAAGDAPAYAASQSEKRAARCRRALQPKPSPLRTTRTTGRAASCGEGATRSGSPAARLNDSRNNEGPLRIGFQGQVLELPQAYGAGRTKRFEREFAASWQAAVLYGTIREDFKFSPTKKTIKSVSRTRPPGPPLSLFINDL